MDKFPLIWRERPLGEMSVEREALYTRFTVCCRLPEPGLWCAWAVGEQGQLRLGVLEPVNGKLTIRRRFSRRVTEPLGKLVQGELRPAAGEGTWEPLGEPGSILSLCIYTKSAAGRGGSTGPARREAAAMWRSPMTDGDRFR